MFEEKISVWVEKVRLNFNKQVQAAADKSSDLKHTLAEKVFILKTVASLQLATVKRRAAHVKSIWQGNQDFTFWLIPGDGQTIAKKSVAKQQLKRIAVGLAAVFFVMAGAIGVLGYQAMENKVQSQELAEYRQNKKAQEQTINELRQVAEKNQQQLAYLSKLEDKVRAEMQKSGTSLPPKSDGAAYAGKGGATLGNAGSANVVMEQEKNIQRAVLAKKADFEKLLQAIENENYRREVTPSKWPTSGGEITSYFGGRANPFDGYSADWHSGIDIANYTGAPVYAAAAGYVEHSGWYGGYGRYVRLNHDLGYVTAYGHMSSLAVNAGTYVKKGQVIGYVGSSGYSTGPHLHFEVYKNGAEVDPLSVVR